MSGIRAEFVFEGPGDCPVAAASATTEGPVTDVSWTSGNGTVTEQFSTTGEPTLDDVEPVFDYGSRQVYEFDRGPGQPCLCEHIEQEVGPVTEAFARDGDLHVTIHAGDVASALDIGPSTFIEHLNAA